MAKEVRTVDMECEPWDLLGKASVSWATAWVARMREQEKRWPRSVVAPPTPWRRGWPQFGDESERGNGVEWGPSCPCTRAAL